MDSTTTNSLADVPYGARFMRADLHVHSHGASHDVKDPAMTTANIVDVAIREKLQLIALTDHNTIANVEEAVDLGQERALVVIPGVELSTPEGHLLVYFETVKALATFVGKLDLEGEGTDTSRCQSGMLDCLNRAAELGGLGILAHVTGGRGLESVLTGYPPHKIDILKHPALCGFEVPRADCPVLYSPEDEHPERASIGKQRQATLGLGPTSTFARVQFSDAHDLKTLGRNAAGDRKLTRIKMDTPTFEGLRVALLDADARVRLEETVPPTVPYVKGINLEGGFPVDQTIHFSRNLTCIIGGRGTGKSTALEGLRVALNRRSDAKVVDSEAWPDDITLWWMDASGDVQVVHRRKFEEPQTEGAPASPLIFPIKCYSQGETADVGQQAKDDPQILLKYLDGFIDASDLCRQEDAIRQQLLENQTAIEQAQLDLKRLPDYAQALKRTKEQLAVLEKEKARQIVEFERDLQRERSLREDALAELQQIDEVVKSDDLDEHLEALVQLADPNTLRVGKEALLAIIESTAKYRMLHEAERQAQAGTGRTFLEELRTHLRAWHQREAELVKKIAAKRQELAGQNIRLDAAFITKLAQDEAKYQREVARLVKKQEDVKVLSRARSKLLEQRASIRSSIYTVREAFARGVNKKLGPAMADLKVTLRFEENALSPEAEEIIKEVMAWRTVQVPRAAALVRQVTVPRLLEAVRKQDHAALARVKYGEGEFGSEEAKRIVGRMREHPEAMPRLERCRLDDFPRLVASRRVEDAASGETHTVSREFAHLSMGQQQSVLLGIALSADSTEPLIIDQPEDNLDAEFIYHSLVRALRLAKERRQVIVATHNANIAVLGDAELIVALKVATNRSMIVGRNSIDRPDVQKLACEILEGSEEAFKRRARVYGVRATS